MELRTLDECAKTYGWDRIGFVKMDAEGEEGRILEGAKQFLREQSPLILFELKKDDEPNLSLLQKFKTIGIDLYRLIPGLHILVPFDANEEIDSYQLNLFGCKADRAHSLEQRNLLVRAESAGLLKWSRSTSSRSVVTAWSWPTTVKKLWTRSSGRRSISC